jgi:hypothetical protein
VKGLKKTFQNRLEVVLILSFFARHLEPFVGFQHLSALRRPIGRETNSPSPHLRERAKTMDYRLISGIRQGRVAIFVHLVHIMPRLLPKNGNYPPFFLLKQGVLAFFCPKITHQLLRPRNAGLCAKKK